MRLPALLLIASTPTWSLAAPEVKPCENGLSRTKIASDPLISNPVSVSVDVDGTIYVTETERRKVADLDIRQVSHWIPDDLALNSIPGKQAFFRENVTKKGLRGNKSVRDVTGDGRIDWKDLTVHTEKIHRLVDQDGDGLMDASTVFAEGFNTEVTGIAAGVLAHRGDVFATIAPDVWRLRDTTGDGLADQRTSIADGFGVHINYAGHDMHGLTFGPDGRLYWTIGDKGTNVLSKDGTRHFYPHEGAVLRCNPDGSEFEVFARGLRNVQEIAFDDFGNLFGVDNDSDRSGEKERFLFISEGADFGWRVHYQYRKSDYNPWMEERIAFPEGEFRPAAWLRPVCSYLDGPAGFSYNPGTALSERYRGSFFLSQFPAGKITAFKTEPDGAGFRMTDSHLVAQGDAFVGSNFGPDGALYVVDWQGGYALNKKGAVWKIDHPASASSPIRKEVAMLLRQGPTGLKSSELLSHLGHLDQRVRLEAQWELARRGEWSLLKQAADSPGAESIAVIHALWGLSQGKQFDREIFDRLCDVQDGEIRAQAAKWAGECRASGADLAPLLADPSPRVRYHAALAIGKSKQAEQVPAIVSLLASGTDPWLRHAAVTALASTAQPSELAALARHPNQDVRVAGVLAARTALDRLHRILPDDVPPTAETTAPYENTLIDFLADTQPDVISEVAIAIHAEPVATAALPALSELLKSSPLSPEPAIRRAISAARQLASPDSLLLLANYAANKEAPEALRLNALDVLSSADDILLLDSVDGRRVDLPKATLTQETRQNLGVTLSAVGGSEALTKAAGTAMDAVGERLGATELAARTAHPDLDPSLRLLALAALKRLDQEAWHTSAIEMLHDGNAFLRRRAAVHLAESDPEAVFTYIRDTARPSTDLAERQAAITLLSKLQTPDAEKEIARILGDAIKGKREDSLLLEIIESATEAGLDTGVLEDSLLANPRHLLTGGNPEKGQRIAETNISANCTACHRFGATGSEVGPPLSGIGAKGRAYILESLIDPQAKIAEGYPSPSSMPPMQHIISQREIRDLVEFLASLK